MAGYIMTLNKSAEIESQLSSGIYSTHIPPPKDRWTPAHEGTLADYISMKENDNLYFFKNRLIYGIGQLIPVCGRVKYLNFPEANIPSKWDRAKISAPPIYDPNRKSKEFNQYRWICFFKPSPFFFEKGIDIDDVLLSNPDKFKMLRVFANLSFIKIDDEENQALKDIILKRNQLIISSSAPKKTFPDKSANTISHATSIIQPLINAYILTPEKIADLCHDGTKLKHEMALECMLLHQLSNPTQYVQTKSILGEWDYLSHQVSASPFKPFIYIDKMDIFGYSYLTGYKPTISKYLIIELKKDIAEDANIDQLMKYVDWVNNEYAHNDYSMIEAYLIAHDFSNTMKNHLLKVGARKYTTGMRPAISNEWKGIKLLRYEYDATTRSISLYNV